MSQIQTAAARGLTPAVDRVRRARGQALAGEGEVLFREAIKYSVQTIPQAGQTLFTFFQDAGNSGIQVTNIPQPGQLMTSGILRIHGITFDVWPVGDDQASVADASALTVAQALNQYLRGGAIRLWSGERILWDDIGLQQCPAGGGPNVATAIGGTIATAAAAAVVTNGLPTPNAIRRFIAPFDVTTEDQIKVEVAYAAAIALPSGVTGRMVCRLICDQTREAAAG